MNRILKKGAIVLAFCGLVMMSFMAGRCSVGQGKVGQVMDSSSREGVAADPSTWTCSMHPQIQQPEPGDCPICGMDLIPLEQDSGEGGGARTMTMSESARALAEIQTTVVERAFLEQEIRLTGKLGYDETREQTLAARFPARIDRLFVNYTGIPVRRGEHLADIYSPDLLVAQQELIAAYERDPKSFLAEIARRKLELWDILPHQIEGILRQGQPSDSFTLRAPIGGVVVSQEIHEGDYVETGQVLFRIVDLSQLWLHLDAYESDLAWLRYGQEVEFSVESLPGEVFPGRIAFIEPEVGRETRTASVRVNVPNEDGRLKPGMFARGRVWVRMGEGGAVSAPEFDGKWISPMHPEVIKDYPGQCDVCGMDLVPAEELGYAGNPELEAPLVIPASAVLRTGRRAVVYVKQPDAERPSYEGREINLGPRAGDRYIVQSGLQEGERVVHHGAFKIDSALQIQAKPSMMNPQVGASASREHHGASETEEAGSAQGADEQAGLLKIPSGLASRLIEPYLELQAALAGDDLPGAKNQLRAMMQLTGHSGDLPDLVHTMLGAESLDTMRRPHFETLSNAMIQAVRDERAELRGTLFLMHCPMVYDDRGADWLQGTQALRNPYFGSSMLKCGTVKEAIRAQPDEQEIHEHE